MKRLLFAGFVILSFVSVLFAQVKAPAPDAAELTKLLNEFLAGASRNDAAIHDKFWADDLIYTGSGGTRRGKAELMKGLQSTTDPRPVNLKTIFTGEDIQIHQYGNAAVVAFRLVATTTEADKVTVAKYYNTGTFIKRRGKWQAVAWQSTKIPDDTGKK